MKYLGIILSILFAGSVNPIFASESTRTIEFRYEPTNGEAVFAKINGHLNDTTIGSSAEMLLKLPNGDLRLIEVKSFRKDDPTFVTVVICDPTILVEKGDSSEPLRIFYAEVKLTDGNAFKVIETSEGAYSLTISWSGTKSGPNKTG